MSISAELKGSRAIVTGATGGIGGAIATALALRGAAVALLVRQPSRAHAVQRAISEGGGHCVIVQCDVSDIDSADRAVHDAREALGSLDILVNNAGVIDPIGHLAATVPAQWIEGISANLVGPYLMARAVLPGFLDQGHGIVLNVSSGAAHTPREGWSSYCAAKAGAAMLTRSIDLEYRARGVLAFGLQPGLVDTEMQVRIRASGMNEISRVARDKLQRPERPASVAAWLCTDAAVDLTGKELSMNDADLLRRAGVS